MTIQMSETGARSVQLDSYRLSVMAPDVADVVRSAGGWLFDRVIEGWEVNALVDPDCVDVRPLQILGVITRPVDYDLEWLTDPPGPQALALSADVLIRDARFRREVRKALNRNLTEVTLWGDPGASEIDRPVDSVHVLSAAARAFKTQAALAVGGSQNSVMPTETFRTATSLPVLSRLTPVR